MRNVKRARDDSEQETQSKNKKSKLEKGNDGDDEIYLDETGPKSKNRQAAPFFNPFEGQRSGRQFNETVDEFVNRVRPSTSTSIDISDHWIWCANPNRDRGRENQDTGGYTQAGYRLLQDLQSQRLRLESKYPEKPPGAITRMLRGQREFTEGQIAELAKKYNVITGKWMLFPTAEDVDQVWRTVAQATWDGSLGGTAKVAPHDPHTAKPEQLICVYTEDFSDVDDVKHVLVEMKRLGLVKDGPMARVIYYKCDAYTYLDLGSGNEYKIKASLYNSRDMFKEMSQQKSR